jgi:cryptochrome
VIYCNTVRRGWIHHLARHSVACFLTRGDLWQSWEAGAEVFDRLLLDADWAINHGNWMWLSASAFFHQYYRVYSPVSFGKQYDPNGDYIRHFIPVLKNMPAKYIFSPWEAPLAVQQKAGCIIGQDYPLPIVDHDSARDRNLKMMKAAYGGAGQAEEVGEGEEGGDGRGKVSAAKRPKQK